MNVNLSWRKKEELEDGTKKEHYLNIPIKVVNSVDSGYGYKGKLICNKCENSVEQFYICASCSDRAKIGEILKRQDDKTEITYNVAERDEFIKNEIDKEVKVIEEIDNIYETLTFRAERIVKPYEVYTNDDKVTPVVKKIYNYLLKNKKGLVCEFGSKKGKIGGVLIAGDGKLLLIQLRDHRLIRQPKQTELQQAEQDATAEILNNVSENDYPELMETFIEKVRNGEKIEVTVKEKPKLVVEVPSFLD